MGNNHSNDHVKGRYKSMIIMGNSTSGFNKHHKHSHHPNHNHNKESNSRRDSSAKCTSSNLSLGYGSSSDVVTNGEAHSTNSASTSTKIDGEKLLQKFDVQPPAFEVNHQDLVVESWTTIELHIAQIGLTSYLEMFKRAPESLSMFPFLKHLSNEDLEFYSQLRDHAVRVTGVLSMLVKLLERRSDDTNDAIRDFLLELGRRHFSYGALPRHMELLGCAFVDSLQPVFEDNPKRDEIHDAWFKFFRLITFWMEMGFKFVQTRGT